MWQTYIQPASVAETVALLQHYTDNARLIAGGTDVLVELQRGVKPTNTLIDISILHELRYIREDEHSLALGALTTHNDVLQSALCLQHALPLVQACQEVGAPQIRTRATIAGNLLTASPANDTIPPLLALDADLVLSSSSGERLVPLSQFYQGVRRTQLRADEMLREIRIPISPANRRSLFLKLGLRRAQAISVVNLALVLTFEQTTISEAHITLGCVAPTVVRAHTVEKFLIDKELTRDVWEEAAPLVLQDCAPIDDVRASAAYRRQTLVNLLSYGLERLSIAPQNTTNLPTDKPVLLEGETARRKTAGGDSRSSSSASPIVIETILNGEPARFEGADKKTLLNLLREDAGLTGCKEGCAEGECGACTVWLDGRAVMSCLVPAAQAHQAEITTIEGLGKAGQLHPLQQAFIDCAAVQCGFCIPGMLMAGAKLFDEIAQPTEAQMRSALSGNLCRCTGYRKILDAMAVVGGGEKQ
ncbi:MAG TPA: FAD binding domain-containing protein [Ktedonobacteraceae bacterium]|nr:FAD binding domain-containing protein [Ktedonobacteraceae bacterium]